jgi:hypothetical protein
MPGWLRQAASIGAILCMVLAVWSVAVTIVNPVPDDAEPGWLPMTAAAMAAWYSTAAT